MGSRYEAAIARARHVLAGLAEPVEKTIWGSPAGKKRWRAGPEAVKVIAADSWWRSVRIIGTDRCVLVVLEVA